MTGRSGDGSPLRIESAQNLSDGRASGQLLERPVAAGAGAELIAEERGASYETPVRPNFGVILLRNRSA